MIKLDNLILFSFLFYSVQLTDLAIKQLKEKYSGQPTQVLFE